MNTLIQQVKSHLEKGRRDLQPVWETLCWDYVQANPGESEAVRGMFQALDGELSGRSLAENHRVIYLVCDLCVAHEKRAFLAGVKTGARLTSELEREAETEN